MAGTKPGVAARAEHKLEGMGLDPKANIFLTRYIHLAHAIDDELHDGHAQSTTMTIAEMAALWDCSERAAQESVRRLQTWGLIRWHPRAGRGKRSDLALLVHPVHVYFERAQHALEQGALAEAGFWLQEVIRECPCIPAAAMLLTDIRHSLGISNIGRCCDESGLWASS